MAMAVPTRELREMIRNILGPDLVFVVLGMTRETTMKRLQGRHGKNAAGVVDVLMKLYNIYEPAGDDESNAVNIVINPQMTPEDVADDILDKVNNLDFSNL